MPKCRYCKERFYAEIALGMHLMTRRANKKCPTPEEMKANGYEYYHGAWLTTEAQWNGTVGKKDE